MVAGNFVLLLDSTDFKSFLARDPGSSLVLSKLLDVIPALWSKFLLDLIIEDFDFDFDISLGSLKRLGLDFTPLGRTDIEFLLGEGTVGFDSVPEGCTESLLGLGSSAAELDNIKFRSLLLDLGSIALDFGTGFSLGSLNRVGLHLTVLGGTEKTFLFG